jgi:hypothetical protein
MSVIHGLVKEPHTKAMVYTVAGTRTPVKMQAVATARPTGRAVATAKHQSRSNI